jgi:ATP-dependent protease ClpP protease subunit/polyhydroxyalkanoate synthesis regulator phasin
MVETFTNIATENNELTIELVGVVGFEINSEELANKINEAKSKGVESVKVILESPGGDMAQGLAIYSILKNSGLKVKSYLRGANASASTLIASAANVEDIYMDGTGLYLIHKPMSYAEGNAVDMEKSKNFLDKWELSAKKIYKNLGVAEETINNLMERNGGHGEWLSFEEAKEYGFVGNEWQTIPVLNYTQFNITNSKKIDMAENIEKTSEDKTLLEKIWNKLSSTPEVKNELSDEEKTSVVSELMQIIEPRLAELEAKLAEMMPVENNEYEEKKEEEEVEMNASEAPKNAEIEELKNTINNLAKAIAEPKDKATVTNKATKPWERIYNAHKTFKN